MVAFRDSVTDTKSDRFDLIRRRCFIGGLGPLDYVVSVERTST